MFKFNKIVCGGVREYNYDLLRIVCTIAVITIHVSGIYYNCLTQTEFFGQLYTQNAFLTCIYNGISRFAVPCFVMLSGAFLLANPKNQVRIPAFIKLKS